MEELTPENTPIFGYPALNYTPRHSFAVYPTKATAGKATLTFGESSVGRAMAEQSEQRATLMWNQLKGSIFIHNPKKNKKLLISRIID